MKQNNRILWFCMVWCLFLCCSCCDKKEPDAPILHNMLIYMAANNNLSSNAITNFNDILKNNNIPENQALFVFMDRPYTDAYLMRVYSKKGVTLVDTVQNFGRVKSADVTVLSSVIMEVRTVCPAATYGLVLWSHATGWLSKGLYGKDDNTLSYSTTSYALQNVPAYSNPYNLNPAVFQYNIYDPAYPQVKTFGLDDASNQIEIKDLATALQPFFFEYICFDACLMASIEAYYDLKEVCRYVIGSPTEIMSYGFPYNQLVTDMFPYTGEANLVAWSTNFYLNYEQRSGTDKSGTISVVRMAEMNALAAAFKEVVAHGKALSEVDRNALQYYDRLKSHLFYDLDHLAVALTEGTPNGSAVYDAFQTALEKAIVYKKATAKFITIPITHFSGLSAYVPYGGKKAEHDNAFMATSWNKAVGLYVE